MAGKSNLTATLFSQKKLLGRAHTSNLKSDAQEAIPSGIQIAAHTIFGQEIPENPVQQLYIPQSASAGGASTVEYVDFIVQPIGGTSYDANTGSFGNVGFGGGDEETSAGTHGYKLVMTGNYEQLSLNTKRSNGYFDNDRVVYETLGKVQLVPPNFSNQAANPYFLKLYKGDPSDPTNEITSLDETDWQIDYYSGIIFIQDYRADRVPTYARGFLYVGNMTGELTLSGSSGGGSGGGDDHTNGVTFPQLTTVQRDNLGVTTNGTMIFNVDADAFQYYQDGVWEELSTSTTTTTVNVAGVGSGILTLTDDGPSGSNRALLQEYATNPLDYVGKTLYLANTAQSPIAPFVIGSKFYFNEGGIWHPSHFFSSNTPSGPSSPSAFPDVQDILTLDANRAEDRAILTGLTQNSGSYAGRAIYLVSTGSGAIGEFIHEQKYYFNEAGVWFVSNFYAKGGP